MASSPKSQVNLNDKRNVDRRKCAKEFVNSSSL